MVYPLGSDSEYPWILLGNSTAFFGLFFLQNSSTIACTDSSTNCFKDSYGKVIQNLFQKLFDSSFCFVKFSVEFFYRHRILEFHQGFHKEFIWYSFMIWFFLEISLRFISNIHPERFSQDFFSIDFFQLEVSSEILPGNHLQTSSLIHLRTQKNFCLSETPSVFQGFLQEFYQRLDFSRTSYRDSHKNCFQELNNNIRCNLEILNTSFEFSKTALSDSFPLTLWKCRTFQFFQLWNSLDFFRHTGIVIPPTHICIK